MRKTERLLPYNPAAADRRTRARIESVANARTLEHATIGRDGLDIVNDGAARLYDADGNLVLRIGLLSSGDHGIEAIQADGTSVQLSTLAFKEQSDEVETGGIYKHRDTLATWGDLTDSPGPVVPNVRIGTTGQARVTLSALINATTGAEFSAAGFMGVEVRGPTNIDPIENRAVGMVNGVGPNTAIALTASRTFKLKGLAPGLYTFTAKYIVQTQLLVGFNAREVIVHPY